MGLVLEFDVKNNILRGTLQGPVTDTLLLAYHEMGVNFTASHPPCRGIWDLSHVTDFTVSGAGIPELAARPSIIAAGYVRVIVAPLDLLFGMARMFQLLSDDTRPELQVVRTMDEAYRLLSVETPEFSPVS